MQSLYAIDGDNKCARLGILTDVRIAVGRRDSLVCWLLPEVDFLSFLLLQWGLIITKITKLALTYQLRWNLFRPMRIAHAGLFQIFKRKMSSTQGPLINCEQWQLLHRSIFVLVIRPALLFYSCTQYHIALNSNGNAGLVSTLTAFVSLLLALAFALLNNSNHRVLTLFRLTK